jgi:hypothetical protein
MNQILNNDGKNKTLKVKVFDGVNEHDINSWLRQFPNIRIMTIKQSSKSDRTLITIWYFLD